MRLNVKKSKFLTKGHFQKRPNSVAPNLTFFMVRGMVTRYLVIKDVIPNIKGFNTTNSTHFNQEMFLSWAIDQNRIKHDLLLGLSKLNL